MRVKTKQINLPIKVLVLFLLLLPISGRSQKWVADSLTIQFGQTPKMENLSFAIESAIDYRNQSPGFVSVFERKKWLFFPVDQVVKTSRPINSLFTEKFYSNSYSIPHYRANIREFYIVKSKRGFQLFSTLELLKSGSLNDTSLVGTFYYEQTGTFKKKEEVAIGYEKLIEDWCTQFNTDVLAVQQGIDLQASDKLYNFRREKTAVSRNFYTSVEFFAGLNFWGVDGELWFSEPEGKRKFDRSTGIIRYVNHPTFQAIAFGRNVWHWNYRVNENWLFTNKFNFLIGVNNWKDMKTAHHKLEEIPLFDLSLTQHLNYNRFDKKGIVFGLGLIEDVHYIIYHQPKINIGLAINCAYKF